MCCAPMAAGGVAVYVGNRHLGYGAIGGLSLLTDQAVAFEVSEAGDPIGIQYMYYRGCDHVLFVWADFRADRGHQVIKGRVQGG